MMRTYGVLTENREVIYLFEKYQEIDLEERELGADEQIIRIDAYTVLASGPSVNWKRDDKS